MLRIPKRRWFHGRIPIAPPNLLPQGQSCCQSSYDVLKLYLDAHFRCYFHLRKKYTWHANVWIWDTSRDNEIDQLQMLFLGSKSSKMQNIEIILLKYFLSIQKNQINLNWEWVLMVVIKVGPRNKEFLSYWSNFFQITLKQR